MSARLIVIAAIALVAATSLHAAPKQRHLSYGLTETLLGEYHLDNEDGDDTNDEYGVVMNKLDGFLKWGMIGASARFDLAYFVAPPQLEDADGSTYTPYADDFNLEKLKIEAMGSDFQLTLGDFYASFGRGFALNLRRIDELGLDTTLRGASASYMGQYVSLRALAGLSNVNNVDTVVQKKIPDPQDLLAGVQIEVTPAWWLRLGGHAVILEGREDLEDAGLFSTDKSATIVGATLELPGLFDGLLSLYGEVDYMTRTTITLQGTSHQGAEWILPDTDEASAWAGYGSATAILGKLTLTAEFRYLDDWYLEATAPTETKGFSPEPITYIQMPTLEKEDLEIEALPSSTGGRLLLRYRIPSLKNVIIASLTFFPESPREDEWVLHGYGGVEQKLPGSLAYFSLMGGYRAQHHVAPSPSKSFWYLQGTATVPIVGKHGVGLVALHEDWSIDDPLDPLDFVKGQVSLSYDYSPILSVAASYEYSTEFEKFGRPVHFFGGSLTYRWTTSSFVRLFAGSTRGGLTCSGGVCRVFPSFTGVKLEAVFRL